MSLQHKSTVNRAQRAPESIEFQHPQPEGVFLNSERCLTRKSGARVGFRVFNPDGKGNPDLWVPGFMATGLLYQPVAGEHATQSDSPNATLNITRLEQNPLMAFSPSRLRHAEWLHAHMVVGAIDALQEKYQRPVSIKPHSMAGRSTTEAMKMIAKRHKERGGPPLTELVSDVTYLACVGFEDPKNRKIPFRKRGFPFVREELLPNFGLLTRHFPEREAQVALRSLKHIALNPFRTFAEGVTIIPYDMRQDVEIISNSGVHTRAITFGADRLIPESEHRAADVVHEHQSFPDETVGHMGPNFYPAELAAFLINMSDSSPTSQAA